MIPTRDDNSDSADEDIEQYPKLYRRSDQSTFARIISSPYIIFVACFGLSVCSFWAGTYLQRERVVMGSRLAEKTSMWCKREALFALFALFLLPPISSVR